MKDQTIFSDGDLFFDTLIEKIRKAKHLILIESYIFETDFLGKLLIQELIQAKKRNIEVYILMDGIGSSKFSIKTFKELQQQGIYLRFYNPLPWQKNDELSLRQKINFTLKYFKQINKRNHKKLILIDGRIAFIGSLNITSLHSKRLMGMRSWRDSGIALKNREVIDQLTNSFFYNWRNFLLEKKEYDEVFSFEPHLSILRLNHKNHLREFFFHDLIRKVRSSKRRIWITNPYFVPSGAFSDALKSASQRGVDVKLIVPKRSDLKLFPLINSLFYRKLIKVGVQVFEYRPRILHAKTLIIDDWSMIGSSNLNFRSRFHDLEVDFEITNKDAQKKLTADFLNDLSFSRQIQTRDILTRYPHDLFSTFFIKLIKYWL